MYHADFPGPEDITRLNNSTLIFSQGDLLSIFVTGNLRVSGGIYAILDAHSINFKV
jgi:hypothetical protein